MDETQSKQRINDALARAQRHSPFLRRELEIQGAVAGALAAGTLDEALAVYAIVNALTTNLPDVTAVQILVDGKEVDTLAGHVDLREPLRRSSAWIRKGP